MKDATIEAKPVIELPAESFSKRGRELPAVIAPGNATSLLQAITQAASNPATDIEKMERLFAMHQKMVAQEAEAAFNGAMARAQAGIQPIVNNSKNEFTKSAYADLSAINKIIVPLYTAEGLSISFDTETKNDADPIPAGMQRTIAIVSHASGHSRRHHIDLPPDDVGSQGKVNKTGVQAAGSTNSYARRYLTRMIFNLSTEDDDDGNGKGDVAKSMDEQTRSNLEEAIEILEDRATADKLWAQIAAACDKANDLAAHKDLKAKLAAKAKTFKVAA